MKREERIARWYEARRLRDDEHLTYREIGERLNISAGTASGYCRRAAAREKWLRAYRERHGRDYVPLAPRLTRVQAERARIRAAVEGLEVQFTVNGAALVSRAAVLAAIDGA